MTIIKRFGLQQDLPASYLHSTRWDQRAVNTRLHERAGTMISKRAVHGGQKGKPSRRTALKLVAGAGLIGAGCLRPLPAGAATKLRVLTYFFAEPSQAGIFQAA